MELYTEAIVLMRRLLHLQRRSGQTLPLMRWPMLWEALFSTAAFVSTDEMSAVAGVAELGLEMLQLINTLAVLGPDAFPNAATFESFSYELVRGHRVTEQLYATGRKQAAQRVADLKLSRSLVALAVDALPQVEGAAGKMSAPEAATAVHKLQLQVAPTPSPTLSLSLSLTLALTLALTLTPTLALALPRWLPTALRWSRGRRRLTRLMSKRSSASSACAQCSHALARTAPPRRSPSRTSARGLSPKACGNVPAAFLCAAVCAAVSAAVAAALGGVGSDRVVGRSPFNGAWGEGGPERVSPRLLAWLASGEGRGWEQGGAPRYNPRRSVKRLCVCYLLCVKERVVVRDKVRWFG